MKIEKSRHLTILYKILNHEGVITSDDLASATRASVRTIKNDICEINDMLIRDQIGNITSEPFKGYLFVPKDEETHESFRAAIYNKYSFFKKQGLEKMTRRLFIIQRLLLDEYTLVDDIADEMFLTKSAIKDDMKYVTNFFNSYDLKLETVVGKGLKITGDEIQKRAIMVECFSSQYYSLDNNSLHQRFSAMFYPEKQYYDDLRHAVLALLRDTHLVLRDIHTKKLATYLCLAVQQIKKGITIHYSQGIKEEIQPTYEYLIAKLIVQLDLVAQEVVFNEDEILGIAILLVCNRDVDLSKESDLATLPSGIVGAAGNLLDRVIKAMKDEVGANVFPLDLFDLFRSDFISLLIPIQLTSLYDRNSRHRLATYNDFMEHKCSPIPTDMARSFLIHVENFIHDELDNSLSISFIYLFEYLFKKINYKYKKRRLLVCSTNGLVVSRNLNDFINEKFASFIEYSSVYNIYEMRKLNFEDYDCILTENQDVMSYYPLDFITCNTLSVHDGTIDMFNKVFIQGYDRSMIDFMTKITRIFLKFDCDSYLTFLKLISFKHAINNQQEALEKSFYRKATKFSYYLADSGIALVPIDYKYCKQEFIEVYEMKNKIYWSSNMEIRYIIAYCINSQHSVSELKMINKILSYCWYEQIEMESLMTNINCTYNEIFDTVILNHFLRK